MNAHDFLKQADIHAKNALDRAILLIWHSGRDNPNIGLSAKEASEIIEESGHAKQNVSRLNIALSNDIRTVKDSNGGWKLRPKARRNLDELLQKISEPKPITLTDSVLPNDLFAPCGRRYITNVVEQINKSFDARLYDCCAVMCRRLIETLIIELYENKGKANEIKGSDDHYFMLSGLISAMEKNPPASLNRGTIQALPELKKLGDLSAHNRHYSARESDITRWREAMRSACEELLHKASLI